MSGGRVSAVAGVPGKNDTYYVGAADGGVFRTTNGGMTWTAEFQHQPSCPSARWRWIRATPKSSGRARGRETSATTSRSATASTSPPTAARTGRTSGLDATFQIPRIVIDPQHTEHGVSSRRWAARGRTTRSAASSARRTAARPGRRCSTSRPTSGIADVAMDPVNPHGALRRDVQVPAHAVELLRRRPRRTRSTSRSTAARRGRGLCGHGLPTTPMSRIGLADRAQPAERVYAAIGSTEGVIWRSDDAGANWTMVEQRPGGRRPLLLLLAHGGRSDQPRARVRALDVPDGVARRRPALHADREAGPRATTTPSGSIPSGSGRIIEGNDGGVILSRDNGAHWQFVHNLAIGQLYHVAADGEFPYLVCGGLQDNSAWCGPGWSQDPTGILDRDWFATERRRRHLRHSGRRRS